MYGIPDVRNVKPDRWLDDGDVVTVAGHTFNIFHCPGHSPGSVVFFDPAQRFALVGDVLFRGSIGRTDFPYGDHDALIAAIKTSFCRWATTLPSSAGTARRDNSARSG